MQAQKMFEQATLDDPAYAEAWNKLAVVLYLNNECVPASATPAVVCTCMMLAALPESRF